MANEDLAYFAGLIDGEGCITIKRSSFGPKDKHRRRSPTYVFSFAVEMADPRPIKSLCNYFNLPFNVNTSRNLKDPVKHRYLFVAQVGAQRGIDILKALLPYFRAKRQEAETAIEFYEECFPPRLVAGRNRKPVPQSLLDLRHTYYLKLRELKTRRFPEFQKLHPHGEPG